MTAPQLSTQRLDDAMLLKLYEGMIDQNKLVEAGWLAYRAMVMQKTAPHATQPQMEEYRAAFFGGVAYFFGLIEHQFSDDDRTEAEERISSVLVHVRDELMGMAGKYMKTGEGSKT